jgi:hypothetical protein
LPSQQHDGPWKNIHMLRMPACVAENKNSARARELARAVGS